MSECVECPTSTKYSDLAHTRRLSYINSRCQSVDTAGSTAMHTAVPVRFQMTVYSAGGVASLHLPLSPSPMPPAAVTWVMHGWKEDRLSQLQCGVYDGAGCTNFFVLKMRFCAGYRHVRVICVCGVYVWKYGNCVCMSLCHCLCLDAAVNRSALMPPVYRKSKAAMMSTPSPGLSLAAGDLSAANHMPSTSSSTHTTGNYCTIFWHWLMSQGDQPTWKSGKSVKVIMKMWKVIEIVLLLLCVIMYNVMHSN